MLQNRLFCFFLILSNAITAQKTIELISVAEQVSLPTSYDSVYPHTTQEKIFSAQITLPIRMSEANIWYTSVNYDNFHVDSKNIMAKNIANPIRVQSVVVRTGLIHQFSKKRAVYVFFAPRMQGDYYAINSRTFQFGGVFLFEKEYRSDFTMRFGAAYNQDYVGPFFVPLVYLYRQFTPKLKIVATMPQDFRLNYRVSDNINVGFFQFASASIFHLGNKNYVNDYMYRESINLSLYGRHKIKGPLYAELNVGYSYSREYIQYNGNDKVTVRFPSVVIGGEYRKPRTVLFEDGAFFNLRLVFEVNVPETIDYSTLPEQVDYDPMME